MYGLLLAVIYLAFVSLGLPDSLLGSAWPTMQVSFNVPSSYAGYVSMMISAMTIISSLISPKLMEKMETKWIVIISIGLTVIGLIGFSFCTAYWMMFIYAVPYGLGAGSIDSALNHYVALHYSSRVMNFLHCFYGFGAIISPNIMALALKNARWNYGYRWTAYVQLGIMVICLLSLPLWKINEKKEGEEEKTKAVSIRTALAAKGVIFTLLAFFCYCAGEATCFLWTASYFEGTKEGMSKELIASFGSLIFLGLMLGRFMAGLISNKVSDRNLIRAGFILETTGIILTMIPVSNYILAMIGFILIGIGMGPVYPSIQHMAIPNFGKEKSTTVVALQMASAYVGSTFMPTVFGLLQENLGIKIMPYYLLVFAVLNAGFLELTYLTLRKK